ncbi:TlpA family protein disulfide reductase [Streptomyces sp. NPDC052236]|uniref:TlpA family protein disulfide reductase n=1 Tax=Streptomyces sp. NPDC052236 TaxID=3365686 RepID=UPI0037D92AEE
MSLSRGSHALRSARTAVLTAVVAAAALTLSACGAGKSGGGGNTNFVTGTGGIATVAEGKRTAPNELSGTTLQGKQLDVADYKGKIVVLNLWGSWCGPCRGEAKYFSQVAAETKAQGVEFVGINTRDPQKNTAIRFEEEHGVEYPSLYDPMGKLVVNGFPRGTLNPQAIPTTIVLDREGKIAARSLQGLDDKKLHEMIDPLIAEK